MIIRKIILLDEYKPILSLCQQPSVHCFQLPFCLFVETWHAKITYDWIII